VARGSLGFDLARPLAQNQFGLRPLARVLGARGERRVRQGQGCGGLVVGESRILVVVELHAPAARAAVAASRVLARKKYAALGLCRSGMLRACAPEAHAVK
jgi:hypothetical protein